MEGLNEVLVMAGILILCEVYYKIRAAIAKRSKRARKITRIRRIKRK